MIESHLGAFAGGGYGTTGHKPAGKQGHYFWGRFRAAEHQAADNLRWLRQVIDRDITFWQMAPATDPDPGDDSVAIFRGVHPDFRVLAWPDREYVLASNRPRAGVEARLPEGRWEVTRYDAIVKASARLAEAASGTFNFDAPSSRTAFFHFRRIDVP